MTRLPHRSSRGFHLGLLASAVVVVSACGMRGLPLPPLVILPETVPLTVIRLDDEVYITLDLPVRNSDGSALVDLDHIELYALTTHPDPEQPVALTFEDWLEVATLVAEIPADVIDALGGEEDTALGETVAADDDDADPAAAGDESVETVATINIVVLEQLTADVRMVPSLDDFLEDEPDQDDELDEEKAALGPLMTRLPVFPRRTYRAIAVTTRGRESVPSPPQAVTLADPTPAPGPVAVTYTETAVTLTWLAPALARVPVQLPAAVTGLLESTPILEMGVPSTYQVYAFDKAETIDGAAAGDLPIELPPPLAPPPPVALNPGGLDITTTWHVEPEVVFGVNRCYVVRVVDQVEALRVLGPSSTATCVAPVDTFPPSPPTGLIAVASDGGISLVWDASPESDVVGYLVLRGDAPGATLERLTVEPVDDTAYRDTTVVADQSYVYAAQAVDGAETPNLSLPSSEVSERAR